MKGRRKIVVLGLIATITVGVYLIASAKSSDSSRFLNDRAMIIIRSIGHQLLLTMGDSTSRVMPVKQMAAGIYQLEFQNKFSFTPDTLVGIVRKNMASFEIPVAYLINIFDCDSNEIVYAFEINPIRKDIIPCLGRTQAAGCYHIQIAFIDFPKEEKSYQPFIWSAVVMAGFSLFLIFRTKEENKPSVALEENSVRIGKYFFSADRRQLKNESETIDLSEKEAKLLHVLASQPNQLITRDQLLKEVWENDGIFTGRSLDMFISKLRKKLGNDPSVQIVNSHGQGYTLRVE